MIKTNTSLQRADATTTSVGPSQARTRQDAPASSELRTKATSNSKGNSALVASPTLTKPLGRFLGIGSSPGDKKQSYIVRRIDLPDTHERRSSIHGALEHALSPQSPTQRKSIFRRHRGSVGSAAGVMEFLSLDDDDDEESCSAEVSNTSMKKKAKKKPPQPQTQSDTDKATSPQKYNKNKEKVSDLFLEEAPQFDLALEASIAPTTFESGYLPIMERSYSDGSSSKPYSASSIEGIKYSQEMQTPKKERRAKVKAPTLSASHADQISKSVVTTSETLAIKSTSSKSHSDDQTISRSPLKGKSIQKTTISSMPSRTSSASSSSRSQSEPKSCKSLPSSPLKISKACTTLIPETASCDDHQQPKSRSKFSKDVVERFASEPTISSVKDIISNKDDRMYSPVSSRITLPRALRSLSRKSKSIGILLQNDMKSTTSLPTSHSGTPESKPPCSRQTQPVIDDKKLSPKSPKTGLSRTLRSSPQKSKSVDGILHKQELPGTQGKGSETSTNSTGIKSSETKLLYGKAKCDSKCLADDRSETGSVGLNDEEPKPKRALRRRLRPNVEGSPSNPTRSRSLPTSRPTRFDSSVSANVTLIDSCNESSVSSVRVPTSPSSGRNARSRSRSQISSQSFGAQHDTTRRRSLSSTTGESDSMLRRRERSTSPSSMRSIKNRTRLSAKIMNENPLASLQLGLTGDNSSVVTNDSQSSPSKTSHSDLHSVGTPPLSPSKQHRPSLSRTSRRCRRASSPLSPTIAKPSAITQKTPIVCSSAQPHQRQRSFPRDDSFRRVNVVVNPCNSKETSDETMSVSTTSRDEFRLAASVLTSHNPIPSKKSVRNSRKEASSRSCTLLDSSIVLEDLIDKESDPRISSLTISDLSI